VRNKPSLPISKALHISPATIGLACIISTLPNDDMPTCKKIRLTVAVKQRTRSALLSFTNLATAGRCQSMAIKLEKSLKLYP